MFTFQNSIIDWTLQFLRQDLFGKRQRTMIWGCLALLFIVFNPLSLSLGERIIDSLLLSVTVAALWGYYWNQHEHTGTIADTTCCYAAKEGRRVVACFCIGWISVTALIFTPITGTLDRLAIVAFIVAVTIGFIKFWKGLEERYNEHDLGDNDHTDY